MKTSEIDYKPILPGAVLEECVKFFDTKNGKVIKGISEPKLDPNHFRIWLRVAAYAPCKNPVHNTSEWKERHGGQPCKCKKKMTGLREGPANLLTNQFAAFVQQQILNNDATNNPKDTGGTQRNTSTGTATSALTGRAGTGTTTAAVTDFALQTETETQSTVTVNANPTTGTTSGTFTVTFTITATADRAYAEVGLTIVKETWTFLLCHDVFSALNVSNTGTLAVTYTFTNS